MVDTKSSVLVSAKLFPNEILRKNKDQLFKIPLLPLNCTFGVITSKQNHVPLKKVVKSQAKLEGKPVTIAFAVRHPGCPMCREHALQLQELAASENVALLGIVKERDDDKILLDFYDNYFKHSLFQDEHWKVYQSMGGRKLCLFKALRAYYMARNRCKAKNVSGQKGKGDVWLQGGLLIFDRRGKLRYAYDEKAGEELDLETIRQAIHEIIYSSKKGNEDFSTTEESTTSRSLSMSSASSNSSKTGEMLIEL